MKIFINYRTGDASFAPVYLEKVLAERYGQENVFRDTSAIPPGLDFRPELWRSLSRSDVLLVVIGPHWLTATRDERLMLDNPDDYVRAEIAMAFRIGIRVIPVLVDGTLLPARDQLPADIKDLNFRQFVQLGARTSAGDTAQFLAQLEQIVAADPGDRPGVEPPTANPAPPEATAAPPAADPGADPAANPAATGRIGFQFNGDTDARGGTWIAGDYHSPDTTPKAGQP